MELHAQVNLVEEYKTHGVSTFLSREDDDCDADAPEDDHRSKVPNSEASTTGTNVIGPDLVISFPGCPDSICPKMSEEEMLILQTFTGPASCASTQVAVRSILTCFAETLRDGLKTLYEEYKRQVRESSAM